MPDGMKFPISADMWLPLSNMPRATGAEARTFARSAPSAASPTASAARRRSPSSRASRARLAHDYPDTNKDIGATVMTFNERFNGGPIRLVFLSLMGAVGFVLLIACANVANLLLARSAQPRARDRRPRVARRDALAHRPPAAGRKRAARGVERRCSASRCAAAASRWFETATAGRRQAVLDHVHHGRQRLRVLRRRLPRHRHCVRPGAGASRFAHRHQRGPEGRAAAADVGGLRARRLDQCAHRRRSRADARAARRRRLHGAQFPDPLPDRSRRRHVAPADDGAGAAGSEVSDDRVAGGVLSPARRTPGGDDQHSRRRASRAACRSVAGRSSG